MYATCDVPRCQGKPYKGGPRVTCERLLVVKWLLFIYYTYNYYSCHSNLLIMLLYINENYHCNNSMCNCINIISIVIISNITIIIIFFKLYYFLSLPSLFWLISTFQMHAHQTHVITTASVCWEKTAFDVAACKDSLEHSANRVLPQYFKPTYIGYKRLYFYNLEIIFRKNSPWFCETGRHICTFYLWPA